MYEKKIISSMWFFLHPGEYHEIIPWGNPFCLCIHNEPLQNPLKNKASIEYRRGTKFQGGLIFAFFMDSLLTAKL